ncbi:MAG TPA: hypothetical protein DIT04_05610 [Dysgonomonas sp.]|nr:hypothetical protein [Dysgonomonas sp.]
MRCIVCTVIAVTLIVLFDSCTSHKKIPYFKNIDEFTQEELLTTYGIHEARIKPNDILSITVNSNIPGAAVDFNLPVVPSNYDRIVQTNVTVSTTGSGSLQNYLVSKDGFISFPVLGDLQIMGMTTEELQDYIVQQIYPRYISEKPVVAVRMLNFKVSVLGEVNRPGIYESENAQMTILDALAAAGDMTIYGKRESVLLLRTDDQGVVMAHRINLQDKRIINDKNFFYLQQNDKLYVETNKAKGNNSTFGTAQTIGLSALSILISIVAILTR